MTTHDLKIAPEWFDDVCEGVKTFEIRKDDRDYRLGDILRLREWTFDEGYTGFETRARVTSILWAEEFPDGLKPGYVVMSIRHIEGTGDRWIPLRYACSSRWHAT